MATKTKAKTKSGAGARRNTSARRTTAKAARPVRKGPQTLRMRSAAPGFTVSDIEKSLAWYRDVMVRIYCTTVQDVDALAKQIKARGGTMTQEPHDQPWGLRDFAVVDPDGFKITIGASAKK